MITKCLWKELLIYFGRSIISSNQKESRFQKWLKNFLVLTTLPVMAMLPSQFLPRHWAFKFRNFTLLLIGLAWIFQIWNHLKICYWRLQINCQIVSRKWRSWMWERRNHIKKQKNKNLSLKILSLLTSE